jgi:hypothetical protein
LAFGFHYQFDASFDPECEEDLCIYPPGVTPDELNSLDPKTLKAKYSLVSQGQQL